MNRFVCFFCIVFAKVISSFLSFFIVPPLLNRIIIFVNKTYFNAESNYNLYLTISNNNPKNIKSETITETIKSHCTKLILKRLDESANSYEILFLATFESYDQLNHAKNALNN